MTILAQLSDLHLSDEDTAPTLALREAVSTLLALTEPPDAVVLTGDLADHGRPAEYALLRTELARLPMPATRCPATMTTSARCWPPSPRSRRRTTR